MKNTRTTFDDAAHKIRMKCVENLRANYNRLFSPEHSDRELKENFKVSGNDAALKNEVRAFIDGVGGQSAGLVRMFLDVRNNEFNALIERKKNTKNTTSGNIKNWLLDELSKDYEALTLKHAPKQSLSNQQALQDLKVMMQNNDQS